MMNPCYDCPKYREHGQYLDEVIPAKPIISDNAEKNPDRLFLKNDDDEPAYRSLGKKCGGRTVKIKKEDVVECLPKIRPKRVRLLPDSFGKCQMGGCDRPTIFPGGKFCKSCSDTRVYAKKMGRPIPTELTTRQKLARGLIK